MSPTRTAPLAIYMFIGARKYRPEVRICSVCDRAGPFVVRASADSPLAGHGWARYSIAF